MIEARTIIQRTIKRTLQRTLQRTAIATVALGLIMAGDARGQTAEVTGTLVVVNKRASTATIVDVRSGATLATLPTGNGPHEVVIAKDGSRAVVTDYGGQTAGNSLTVIDVPGLRVEKTIELDRYSRPHGIAFLPGDSLVAVTSEDARSVVVVRLADGAIIFDHRGRHAQHFALGRIAVGHESALEPIRAAGQIGECLGDQPAGTGFRGAGSLPFRQQLRGEPLCQGIRVVIHGEIINQLANPAILY